MLKESETFKYANRQTHRIYAAGFKAELVAACQLPGVSIAGLARQHGMNPGVLRRWVKETPTLTITQARLSITQPPHPLQRPR